MAKTIRSIKADLCDDEVLGRCSRDARYLFVALITKADDHGRFRAQRQRMKGTIYPYDDDVTPAMVEAWLEELERRGRIRLYMAEGQSYGFLTNWSKHQRIDNAAKSECPEPGEEVLAEVCGDLRRVSASLGGVEGWPIEVAAGVEGIGKEERGVSADQVAADLGDKIKRKSRIRGDFALTEERHRYAAEHAIPIGNVAHEFAKFRAHHEAKGSTMADWDAAWRYWVRNYRGPLTSGAIEH
jgi:hypothetical protein